MDEANNKVFFKPTNIAKMKRFLEGRGWATDTKFGEIGLAFENCGVALTSNTLPYLEEADMEAIQSRCEIIKLNIPSHSMKG